MQCQLSQKKINWSLPLLSGFHASNHIDKDKFADLLPHGGVSGALEGFENRVAHRVHLRHGDASRSVAPAQIVEALSRAVPESCHRISEEDHQLVPMSLEAWQAAHGLNRDVLVTDKEGKHLPESRVVLECQKQSLSEECSCCLWRSSDSRIFRLDGGDFVGCEMHGRRE